MRNGGLRELDALLDVARAEARPHLSFGFRCALLERLQDTAARRIGNGVKGSVQQWLGGRHTLDRNTAEIDDCQY